jgi:hypothetical protein
MGVMSYQLLITLSVWGEGGTLGLKRLNWAAR